MPSKSTSKIEYVHMQWMKETFVDIFFLWFKKQSSIIMTSENHILHLDEYGT